MKTVMCILFKKKKKKGKEKVTKVPLSICFPEYSGKILFF